MNPSWYFFIFMDPFHSYFVWIITKLSLFSNGLLLFIIYSTPSANLGAYRYLLSVFAVCDITTSLGHAGLQPYVHMTSTGFYFFPRRAGIKISLETFDTVFCFIFMATYYQTFLVLAYHFIYRFKVATSGLQISFTNYWSSREWIRTGIIVYILYIGGFFGAVLFGMIPTENSRRNVPSEIFAIYGINLADARIGYTNLILRRKESNSGDLAWRIDAIFSIIVCLSLIAATAIVIVYCIYRTVAAMKHGNLLLSPKAKRMQRNLFRALLIQTSIPCLFSYLPLAIIFLLPFSGKLLPHQR
ncbi:hypothetical protein PFISCL1PPCAC_14156 [Pristionchus fissidentatus]|uniref:G protein-coupled receptor n=1 Tax=Pristionchus fissidentatus TaxID=1538716 RepID=A0AAV5VXR6_9BILA|nr:hypothetical protein PFISCL1PPCAC_14156 [Pristionchus fissidentatus]